jgi:PA14 domain
VTLAAPAPAAMAGKEQASGPLVLVGQDSPVAFKDIRYKTYDTQRLTPQNMAFQLHKGRFRQLDQLPQTPPFRTGTTDTLSHRLGGEDELLTVTGEVEVPRTGDYLFRVSAGGPAWIFLDNKLVVHNQGSRDFERFFYGATSLIRGRHSFKVIFSNHDQSLVLHYEGPGMPWTSLTTPASTRKVLGQEPLFFPVTKEPVLQRGFVVHGNSINTYAAAVGIPGGVNYAYDLNAQAPLSVWHGDFLDVAHMWRERGEKQLALPQGPELQLSGLPSLAFLPDQSGVWPDSLQPDKSPYTNKGYKLQPNGLPLFFYSLPQVAVEDYLAPAPQQEGLTRQLTLRFEPGAGPAYLLLASGRDIEKLPNGAYAVDNKSYYLEQISGGNGQPFLRSSRGKTQLVLPVRGQSPESTISYSIIW